MTNIEIKNCNNIDSGKIQISENKLNIKYAMNGVGKSTIAKAIGLYIKGDDLINELMPFKYIETNTEDVKPSIKGLDGITSVMIFNDDYINQYAFKKDEILTDSFEIFVKTPDYDDHIEKIDEIITEIKNTFKELKEIDQVINDMGVLQESFGKSKSGYSEASPLAKGIGKGNKIVNVPKGLESYSVYLKSSANVKWLRWQMDGYKNFEDISDNCPYCTLPKGDKREVISQVSKEYDPKSIEHLNTIVGVLKNLSKYFSENTKKQLEKLTNSIQGFSKEEINYLIGLKGQIITLQEKMLNIRGLTFFSLKDVGKVSEHFTSLKINLSYLPELNSENTNIIVRKINESLDKVLSKIGILQGEINQQIQLIENTIKNNKVEINDFLRYAGYKYKVDVEYSDQKYKMILRHIDYSKAVTNGNQHLSYGERNALSLILFMYECLAKNPDIVVLDDPISSFDKNKKYAVIDMLFRTKKSLKGKTVLMMTHDLEPVIDIIYNLPRYFEPIPSVDYINYQNGIINEIPITKSDISTFGHICNENIYNSSEDIVKLVYLRRFYEIFDNKGLEYELLSNLLHKRKEPFKKQVDQNIPMTEDEIQSAISKIKDKLNTFDYESLLTKLNDISYMEKAYNNASNNWDCK